MRRATAPSKALRAARSIGSQVFSTISVDKSVHIL